MSAATELASLCAALTVAGVPASMDPADTNTPGAWVALDAIELANLNGGLRLRVSVYLISPDTDPMRALELLQPLLDSTLTVLQPDGQITTQGVVLPDSTTPLPALRVPVHLFT